jgi:hypothetical protein
MIAQRDLLVFYDTQQGILAPIFRRSCAMTVFIVLVEYCLSSALPTRRRTRRPRARPRPRTRSEKGERGKGGKGNGVDARAMLQKILEQASAKGKAEVPH